ncbi:pentatricopeptide repeat-containing protein [Tanacetum coccineum]
MMNLIMKVYSDNGMFSEGFEVFEYMWKNGVEIDEKSCTVYLVEVMRCGNLGLGLVFYDKMVECGIDVSVYSMTVVVDGLCKNGEVRKGMELVEEGVVKGVRPNVITFNTLIDVCYMKGKQKCDDLNEDSQFSENVFGNNNGMRVWVQHLRDSRGVLLDFESSSLHSLPEEQNSGTSVMFSDSSDVMPSSLGDNSYDCFFRRMGSVATPGESSSGEMVSGFVGKNHKWPQSHTRSRKRRIMGHQLFPHRATVAGIGSNTTRIEGDLPLLYLLCL